jgi:DNA (cytosine-5)-methyltransferase 1
VNNTIPSIPRLASFFSGIGGFDLGFERAGFSVSMQCEIDPFARKILDKHWPEVNAFKDIKELTNAEIPISDVWAGGFPCQDVSLARMGPREGLKGSRSGLFFTFAELLGRSLPRVVIIENVQGLLSSHKGRDFELIIRTLAEFGYGVGWRVLNSKHFGVPQSRDRVYIVGCYRDGRGPAEILFEPERGGRHLAPSRQNGASAISPFKEVLGDTVKGPIVQKLAYCLYATSARHTGTDWSRTYVMYPEGRVRRLTPTECEGIQGFPVGWTAIENYSGDPEKLEGARYKALGNAVTVNVAEWLGYRVKSYLDRVVVNTEANISQIEQSLAVEEVVL